MQMLKEVMILQTAKFTLGRLVATQSGLERIGEEDRFTALRRHLSGDWGDVDENDKAANDAALIENTRLVSVYRTETGIKFYVITEGDRSSTSILLPEEY
jgi:hypothetical protein